MSNSGRQNRGGLQEWKGAVIPKIGKQILAEKSGKASRWIK
jgi:hypothetical protein